MGQFVIVAYRPREGKEAQLLQLIKEHVPVLRREGLATNRRPLAMRAEDGTIIEIFEWKSPEAIDQAHSNKTVMELWDKFNEVCEIENLANLSESQHPFSEFEPIDF